MLSVFIIGWNGVLFQTTCRALILYKYADQHIGTFSQQDMQTFSNTILTSSLESFYKVIYKLNFQNKIQKYHIFCILQSK